MKSVGLLALPGMAFSNSSEAKRWFTSPKPFHASKAVMMKNHGGPDAEDVFLFAKKMQGNWGHAGVPHLKRILTDDDGVGATALKVAVSVEEGCDVRAASDKAPHLPVAASLCFSGNLIAL